MGAVDMNTITHPTVSREGRDVEGIEKAQRLLHAADPWDAIVATSLTNPRWDTDALCGQTDPEAFFPEKGGSTREAKKVCMACDVRERCLAWALANDERFGIWGGLSRSERQEIQA